MDRHGAISEDEWRVWRGLAAMHGHLEREVAARLRACDAAVSSSEFDVLAALHDGGGELRARDLAGRLGWEKSRLSHLLTRMHGRGLVDRSTGLPERPGTWIASTPDGRDALRTAVPERIAALRERFFDHVSDEELAVLRRVSEHVLDAMCSDAAERDADADDDACERPEGATA